MKKVLLLLVVVACARSSSIQSNGDQFDLVAHDLSPEDLLDEPVYQPRFFGLFGGGNTNKTEVKEKQDDVHTNLNTNAGNTTVEKLVEVLQNSGNASLEDTVLQLADKLGGNETIGKVVDLLKNSENKTLQENLVKVLSDTAISKFGGDETVKNIINSLQNPGNKTMQENLMNIVTTTALNKFGDNEAVKNIANVLKNSGNKTLQENLVNVATEAALSKFGDNEAIKSIANALKNSDNKTLQANVLNVVSDVALSKFGNNEAVKKIADALKNSGNQSLSQNVLGLATDLALSKFKDNKIIKTVANIMKSSNATVQEKLTAAADAALTTSLGPVGAAAAKTGINAVGQALKVGGGLFGGFLKMVGGNSILGKVGDAITGGSNAVGGLMTTIASGPKSADAAVEPVKAVVEEKLVEVAQLEVNKADETLKSVEERKEGLTEGNKLITEAVAQNDGSENIQNSNNLFVGSGALSKNLNGATTSSIQQAKSKSRSALNKADSENFENSYESVGSANAGKYAYVEGSVGAAEITRQFEVVNENLPETSTVDRFGGSRSNVVSPAVVTPLNGYSYQNDATLGGSLLLNQGNNQGRNYFQKSTDGSKNFYLSKGGSSNEYSIKGNVNVGIQSGKLRNMEITTVKIQMGK